MFKVQALSFLLLLLPYVTEEAPTPSPVCLPSCGKGQYLKECHCLPCPDGFYQDKPYYKLGFCEQWTFKPSKYNYVIAKNGTSTSDIVYRCKDGFIEKLYTVESYECVEVPSTLPSISSATESPKPSTSSATESPKPSTSSVTESPKPSTSSVTESPKPSTSSVTESPKTSTSSVTESPKPSTSSVTESPEVSIPVITLPGMTSVQENINKIVIAVIVSGVICVGAIALVFLLWRKCVLCFVTYKNKLQADKVYVDQDTIHSDTEL